MDDGSGRSERPVWRIGEVLVIFTPLTRLVAVPFDVKSERNQRWCLKAWL